MTYECWRISVERNAIEHTPTDPEYDPSYYTYRPGPARYTLHLTAKGYEREIELSPEQWEALKP